MISCILLSAGLSSRFGGPKALARLDQTPVIEHLQNVLISSNIFEIIVVLGASSEKIKPHLLNHKKIICVRNKNYHLGQSSSFKIGLENVSQKSLGLALLPVDYPLVKTETINNLSDYFLKHKPSILIPTYQDQKGHPPIFHANLTKKLLDLANSTGLNVFEEEMKSKTVLYPVNDPGVILTFNTPLEFEELKKNYKKNFNGFAGFESSKVNLRKPQHPPDSSVADERFQEIE